MKKYICKCGIISNFERYCPKCGYQRVTGGEWYKVEPRNVINIYNETFDDRVECDWRELSFKTRLHLAFVLLLNVKFTFHNLGFIENKLPQVKNKKLINEKEFVKNAKKVNKIFEEEGKDSRFVTNAEKYFR